MRRSGSRLLLLAPNWLGDLVMTTPVVAWLSEQARLSGDTRWDIVLGVRRAWAPLFTADPRLAGLLILERNGRHAGWQGMLRQAGSLRHEGFAGVAVGPPSLRAALAAWLAGIPVRVGYRCDGRSPLLTRPLALPERGTRHFSAEMMSLGAALLHECAGRNERAPEPPAPRIFLPPDLKAAARSSRAGYWVVAPGTTYGEAKTWPVRRVADFLETAVSDRGVSVVLLGDSQTAGFVAALKETTMLPWASAMGGEPAVVDLVGRTPLLQAAALLRNAAAFVGNDSGLMHLAGALGVPTVGVFGSSSPQWTAPRGPRTATVTAAGFSCQPCFRKSCNQERFCLETVTAHEVLAALDRLIAQGNPGLPLTKEHE